MRLPTCSATIPRIERCTFSSSTIALYGSERPYNGLRLALNLAKRNSSQVRVFLMGDGVLCARKGRAIPQGYYNVERMLRSPAMRGEVAT
jgi:sulfur relay (sulfurtransferase) complex TusBCD TusD component (DsrE family)